MNLYICIVYSTALIFSVLCTVWELDNGVGHVFTYKCHLLLTQSIFIGLVFVLFLEVGNRIFEIFQHHNMLTTDKLSNDIMKCRQYYKLNTSLYKFWVDACLLLCNHYPQTPFPLPCIFHYYVPSGAPEVPFKWLV